MKIELKEISVRDLTNGYQDNEENGVVGFGGKLDIRPPYQREFVYDEKERNAVINTLQKDFPLNVMYWAVREDGNFEVIDGQQRTISIPELEIPKPIISNWSGLYLSKKVIGTPIYPS